VVFGEKAVPILTGDTASCVVFAAAQYGRGRLFVTGHEAYMAHFVEGTPAFAQLWRNVKRWLLGAAAEGAAEGAAEDADMTIPSIESYELVADIPAHVRLVRWGHFVFRGVRCLFRLTILFMCVERVFPSTHYFSGRTIFFLALITYYRHTILFLRTNGGCRFCCL
jgi:hypothetical protein